MNPHHDDETGRPDLRDEEGGDVVRFVVWVVIDGEGARNQRYEEQTLLAENFDEREDSEHRDTALVCVC